MKRKLKIAYYCSNRTIFPPPRNIVAANATAMEKIVKGMVEKKHNVFIYASKGSSFNGAKIVNLNLPPHNLDAAYEKKLWVQDLHNAYRLTYLSQLIADSHKYDIIHLHVANPIFGLPFVKFSKCPVVFTLHEAPMKPFAPLLKQFEKENYISVSENQRKSVPFLNYIKTIYHGVRVEDYPFSLKPKKNLLFLSRVTKEKGSEEAIKVAKKGNFNLDIYGPGEKDYLEKNIFPLLDKNIIYHKIAKQYSLKWYNAYSNAKVMILPINIEEPFGLTMIEAMACGTPLVAYARGSVPEIIEDGKTGFIINPSKKDIRGKWKVKKTGIPGLIEGVSKIYSLNQEEYRKMRENCRKHVVENFSEEKMIEEHEKLYNTLTI